MYAAQIQCDRSLLKVILLFIMLSLLLSCKTSSDGLQHEIALDNNEAGKNVEDSIKPIWGYRFVIEGDFDGDGRKEKLTERFVSRVENKETNKHYENLADYDELVALTIQKEPYSFVTSDNPLIDTLRISTDIQQLGLAYLKNEGDLNGDGADEVSYVINWADWSSMNTWYIVTWQMKRWQILYTFRIWDWQLPELPGSVSQYGLFGLSDKMVIMPDDTLNQQLERKLQDFDGLVKKIETNKIQVIYSTDEAELDTTIVDLNESMSKVPAFLE